MTTTPLTAVQLQVHAQTLTAMVSALLTGLAAGKYDPEVAVTEEFLGKLGVVFPAVEMADEALEAFLALNKMTAPRAQMVLAGDGISWVPASNSRYDPKTGEFL